MRKILLVGLAALIAAPAVAQSPSTPAIVVETDKSELERMVCERQEQIGTRLGARKVCKTVREWQEERRVQREDVERVQRVVNQEPSG